MEKKVSSASRETEPAEEYWCQVITTCLVAIASNFLHLLVFANSLLVLNGLAEEGCDVGK